MRRFVAGALLLAVVVRFVWVATLNQEELNDFHAYFRAAERLWTGGDIYEEGKLLVQHDSFDYWQDSDGQYVYPPLLAIALLPAIPLGPVRAHALWVLTLLVSTVGFLSVLVTLLDLRQRPVRLAVVALPVLAAMPLLISVRYGEADLPLLLLVSLALLAYARRHRALAGVGLGIAIAVKPTLGFFGLFFLRKQGWWTIVTAGATALLLGLGPFALLGMDALWDWLGIASYFSRGSFATYPHNQSVRGALLRLFVGGPLNGPLIASPLMADLLWAGVILIALLTWWWSVSPEETSDRRMVGEYALTSATMLVVAPLSEDIHYVALLLPLAFLADGLCSRPPSVWWTVSAAAACLYFSLPMIPDLWLLTEGNRVAVLLASAAYVFGLLVVWLCLVYWLSLCRRGRARTSDTEALTC